MTKSPLHYRSPNIWLTVIVCGLGYFVDIYDLIIFSIVRPESLADIGITAGTAMQDASELILNSQMAGMLLGGILFGILADKKGRLRVLFGSILLYSLMNIANAFVSTVPVYALLRFFSGIGLAGELGVAITLVAEIMPRATRGYGTTAVASLGILGAIAAYSVHELFDWRTTYVVGGVMGLGLLVMRVKLVESGMFRMIEQDVAVARGRLRMLFTKQRLGRFLSCVAIGIPIWYSIGLLVTFAPEFTKEGGSLALISAGQAVMWAYVGLAAGDLSSGLLSQLLRSRRRAILIFLLLQIAFVLWYLYSGERTPTTTYIQTFFLGFGSGYWAVFVTTAAEQFGTNLRATVATTVPNIVRGGLVPILLLNGFLRRSLSDIAEPLMYSALIIGAIVFIVAFIGWYRMRETYSDDLNYVES